MTPLQLVHYWVSLVALLQVLIAAGLLLAGFILPSRSKRGKAFVRWGVIVALGTVAVYLVYCATAVTTTVVMLR